MNYLAITGREHELALAELEAIFSEDNVQSVNDTAVLVDSETAPEQAILGGSLKIAKVLHEIESSELSDGFKYLQETIPGQLDYLPEGKLQFGVSVYGFNPKPQWLLHQMLEIKKLIRRAGRSVRIIQNKQPALSSAQVLYNKLTSELGWELLLIKNGNKIILAQTLSVQDIDEYAARDQARPARDAKVGMLPPKLAQIMLNLANPDNSSRAVVADIFCGSGVVLQEAILRGLNVFGSDLSSEMIEASKTNLEWLEQQPFAPSDFPTHELTLSDARSVKLPENAQAIVSEMYLGEPLHTPPDPEKLTELMEENKKLLLETLDNIASQTPKNTALCIAVPAWKTKTVRKSVLDNPKTVESIKNLGYTFTKFSHNANRPLIYARAHQVVGRQMLVIRRSS